MKQGIQAALLVSAAAVTALGQPATGRAQEAGSLEHRIDSAPDGSIRFHFAAREGVCGNGRSIDMRESDDHGDRWCEPGPVWVEIEKSGGRVADFDMWVGRPHTARHDPRTELGEISPDDASAWLLALARRSDGDVGEDAVGAASLAADVVIWPDLLDMARDESLETDTRESAIFWLGQLAGEKAASGLEDIVASDGDTEVKEMALFALSQLPDGAGFDALVKVVRDNENPDLVQASMFWLGQSGDPRALDLFEEILTRN